jgi:hypothetical protein
MSHRTAKVLLILNLMGLWWAGVHPYGRLHSVAAAEPSKGSRPDDLDELARLYKEDQADRTPAPGKVIDWSVVLPRDRARLARVKELYTDGKLQTGPDYYRSAMVLQHGETPEDYLLAHELCVVAISRGDGRSKWLAAASEDRFLMNIGRPQRFGTQYNAEGPNAPYRLYKTDSGVTDQLRRAFDAPSLAEAKAREAEMNRK